MLALSSAVVGIGWPEVGDLSSLTTTEALRDRLVESYPDKKPSTIANWVGQVDAFQRRMQIGDLVALPLKSTPAVAFGRVAGQYRYVPSAPPSMRYQRAVQWFREDVPRDPIPQDILYSLGAFLTVCRIQRNDAETHLKGVTQQPYAAAPASRADRGAAGRRRRADDRVRPGRTRSRPDSPPPDRSVLRSRPGPARRCPAGW